MESEKENGLVYPTDVQQLLATKTDDNEDAIDILEREAEKRSWTCIFTRLYFRRNKLVNSHPRFKDLLERIGLDDSSVEKLRSNLADLQ